MNRPKINLIELDGCDIYKQLEIEEALLRADNENWCIVNFGSPDSIVLGISSKAEEMIHLDRLPRTVQVIKRFSGGGTVYVDEKTLFITFICNKDANLSHCYPEPILRWGESFYKPVFNSKRFHLNENDYALGEKKIGGNALYIRKDRWLLHTSFLWDYDIEKINHLKHPSKKPTYRQDRKHDEFLTKLKDHYPSIESITDPFYKELSKSFSLQRKYKALPNEFLKRDYRKSLRHIEAR